MQLFLQTALGSCQTTRLRVQAAKMSHVLALVCFTVSVYLLFSLQINIRLDCLVMALWVFFVPASSV